MRACQASIGDGPGDSPRALCALHQYRSSAARGPRHASRRGAARRHHFLVAADQGDMLGDFGLYAKRTCFERSAIVPMILVGTTDHAVNGIGGMAAPALDAPEDIVRLNVLRFAARMWWGALAMLELQNLELGYEIQLDGSEIAHLAAFAASADTQQSFSMDDILEILRPLTINEPYRMGNDWPEDFRCE